MLHLALSSDPGGAAAGVAAIHFGYAGETEWEFLTPVVGTFMLGCFYAWAVRSGRGSLKPVICCHMLIITVLQPWLAFVR